MNMRKLFNEQLKKLSQSNEIQRNQLKSLEKELTKSTQEKFDQITERVVKQQNSPIVKQIQQELSPQKDNVLLFSQAQLEQTKRSLQNDINNQYDEVLGLINSISKVALETDVHKPLTQSQLLVNPQYMPTQVFPLAYQPQIIQPLQQQMQPTQDQTAQGKQQSYLSLDDITDQSQIYNYQEQANNTKLQKIKTMISQQQENSSNIQLKSSQRQKQIQDAAQEHIQQMNNSYENTVRQSSINKLEHLSERFDQVNREITESEARCRKEYDKILQDVSLSKIMLDQIEQQEQLSSERISNSQSRRINDHEQSLNSSIKYGNNYMHNDYNEERDEHLIHQEIEQLEREQQLLRQKQEQDYEYQRQLRKSQIASQAISFIPEGFTIKSQRSHNLDASGSRLNNDIYQTPYPVQPEQQIAEEKLKKTISTLEYISARIDGLTEGMNMQQQENQNQIEAERNILQLFATKTEQSSNFQNRINNLNARIDDLSPRQRQYQQLNQSTSHTLIESPRTIVIPANMHVSKINPDKMYTSHVISKYNDLHNLSIISSDQEQKQQQYQMASQKLQQLIPGRSKEFMYRFYLHLQKMLQKSFSEFLYGVVIANLGQLTDDQKLLAKHAQCGKFQQIIANYFVNKSQIQAAELYVQVVKRLADYHGEQVTFPECLSDAVAIFIEIENKI